MKEGEQGLGGENPGFLVFNSEFLNLFYFFLTTKATVLPQLLNTAEKKGLA